MRGLGSGSFDPKTLATLEAAFDEAWLTLRCNGNDKVRANELARCILRLASEGERDTVRLHDHAACSTRPCHGVAGSTAERVQSLKDASALRVCA